MEYDDEDMGESPITDGRFKAGQSGNPGGRPKGTKNKPRSKMRTQLTKMCELQPDAIEILRIAMTGKDANGEPRVMPAKDKIDMAKFIVNKIESLNKTCLQEELAILGVEEKGNKEGAEALSENQQEATSTGAFSLEMDEDI
jgi:hypothetical protein